MHALWIQEISKLEFPATVFNLFSFPILARRVYLIEQKYKFGCGSNVVNLRLKCLIFIVTIKIIAININLIV